MVRSASEYLFLPPQDNFPVEALQEYYAMRHEEELCVWDEMKVTRSGKTIELMDTVMTKNSVMEVNDVREDKDETEEKDERYEREEKDERKEKDKREENKH